MKADESVLGKKVYFLYKDKVNLGNVFSISFRKDGHVWCDINTSAHGRINVGFSKIYESEIEAEIGLANHTIDKIKKDIFDSANSLKEERAKLEELRKKQLVLRLAQVE